MDKSRKKFVILYLGKKNVRVKPIRPDMKKTLGPDIYSTAQIA
jgi:hypothetical protein